MLNKQAVYEGSQKAVEDEENAKIQAADKQVGSCAICFEAPRTHIFIACGHVCAWRKKGRIMRYACSINIKNHHGRLNSIKPHKAALKYMN